MYKEYFGLEELPFSIAPDPRYLYMSEQHREALAHLVYGFNSEGGFVLLTGDVGTGKTTICRCLLEQMHENSVIAFIINPKLTVEELLAVVCDEFGIHCPKGNTSIKVFVDLINAFLLDVHAMGHKALLIIDEAQNLSADVLEQLRLLTNLETNQCKLLQIILLGQPELKDKLSKPELKQLAQRIIARYHLGPLSSDDVGAYVAHRLSVAGVRRELFPASTINALYRLSGGIPRLINVLCDRALLGAFVQGKNDVKKPTLVKAAKEVFGGGRCENQQKKLYKPILTALLFIVLAAWLASTYFKEPQSAQINKTEPVKLDTLHLPANVSGHLSKETAYQSLFRQWGISYQPSENITVCRQAQMRGLRCLNGIGSLDTLRDFNMPAVLKLFDNEGKEFYAALTSLKDRTAAFIVGTDTMVVSVKDIESRWLGEYTLLWRAPTDYQGEIRPGSGGTVIQLLDRQLAQIQGRSSRPSENLVYD
ncbi:MAG: AAA family ATPase, partial [Nitrospirae bacterium]|nr:AAA family ATPase [Nitrospirota bacterium]